jgi:hypothetical protein
MSEEVKKKGCQPKHPSMIKGLMSLPQKLIKAFEDFYLKACGEYDSEEEAETKAWEYVAVKAKAEGMTVKRVEIECKFVPIVDKEKMSIAGIASTERMDVEGEIADSKYLNENMEYFRRRGSPLLDMHLPDARIGTVKFFKFLDGEDFNEFVNKNNLPKPMYNKGFAVIADVEDSRAKLDIQRGNRKGFSIGYYEADKKGDRYFPILAELSLVDSPCNKDCAMTKAKAEEQAQPATQASLSETAKAADKCKAEQVVKKEIKKEKITMDWTKLNERQKAKILGMGATQETATEIHVKLANLEIEKEDAAYKAEIQAKVDAEVKAKVDAAAAEFAKKEEELKKKYEEMKNAPLDGKAVPITQGIVTPEMVKQISMIDGDNDFIAKGKAAGEYDFTAIDASTKVPVAEKEYSHLNLLKCKVFAQKILDMIASGQKSFSMNDVKVKMKLPKGKTALQYDTGTTGSYLAEISYSDFIVDEPMRENNLINFFNRLMATEKGDIYTIRRRTSYGAANFVATGASFSAVHSTYEKDSLYFKCLRYDGAVDNFMFNVTNLDALAAELYAAKESHDQRLEVALIWGTDNVATTALVAQTGNDIKGLNEHAEVYCDKAGTTITLALLYEAEGNYRLSAKQKPKGLLMDPLLYAKWVSLYSSSIALPTTVINGGIEVPTMNQAAVMQSYALADDSTAAPSFAITKGTGTVDDQLFVRVSAVTINGETVAAAEANDTMSSSQSCIVTITNRSSDLYYIVYLGSATGTVYKYYAVAKSSAATTVFTISAPPTFPTAGLPRKTSADRPFFMVTNDPMKGVDIIYHEDSKMKTLGYDGTGERFQIESFVVAGVKTGTAILKGVFQKS